MYMYMYNYYFLLNVYTVSKRYLAILLVVVRPYSFIKSGKKFPYYGNKCTWDYQIIAENISILQENLFVCTANCLDLII